MTIVVCDTINYYLSIYLTNIMIPHSHSYCLSKTKLVRIRSTNT